VRSEAERRKKKRVERGRKKLQAQTEIIKIKAKNQHDKILNSNNRRGRQTAPDITLNPIACSLAPSRLVASNDSDRRTFFLLKEESRKKEKLSRNSI
jgi:hypothetical protein